MATVGVQFQIKGLNELLGQMTSMQGRGFQKGAEKSLKKVMRVVVVPALRAAAPTGVAHRGAPGKRGRTGPVARNITVKNARKRSGEFVALNAGPRAWWAHFGIAGTKDHVIGVNRKRGAGGQFAAEPQRDTGREDRAGKSITYTVSGRRSRAINRGALCVAGRFYSQVHVKGVKPNDWVSRAAQGKAVQAMQILATDTLPRKDGHGLQGGN